MISLLNKIFVFVKQCILVMGYLLLGFGIGLISAVISGSFLHGLLTYNLVFDETIWVTLMAAFFSLIFIYVVFRFLVSSEKSSCEMISHLDFVKWEQPSSEI